MKEKPKYKKCPECKESYLSKLEHMTIEIYKRCSQHVGKGSIRRLLEDMK